MEIMSAKDARRVVEDFKSNKKFLDLLNIVAKTVKSQSSKGLTSVVITGEQFSPSDKDLEAVNRLNLVIEFLREKGYTVVKYSNTDIEYGCFGASSVAVSGIKVKW